MYVDENVSAEVVTALANEHDVAYLAHTEHKTRTDAWHLQQASAADRILLTHNASDFRFLHRIWSTLRTIHAVDSQHAGVLTTSRMIPAGTWLSVLRARLALDEEYAGRFLTWDQANARWVEDKWRPDD